MQIGPTQSAAKAVLLQFISEFLGVTAFAFQSTFKTKPHDLILIEWNGSTLAVPCDLLLMPREQARQVVAEKIAVSRAAFNGDAWPFPPSDTHPLQSFINDSTHGPWRRGA